MKLIVLVRGMRHVGNSRTPLITEVEVPWARSALEWELKTPLQLTKPGAGYSCGAYPPSGWGRYLIQGVQALQSLDSVLPLLLVIIAKRSP